MNSKRCIFIAILIMLVFIIISGLIPNISLADSFNAEFYRPNSYNTGDVGDADYVFFIGRIIITPLRVIGTVISVAVLLVLGIKYMAGSVEEKAEYKKTMMPYVIGAVLLFGIVNILGIVSELVRGVMN